LQRRGRRGPPSAELLRDDVDSEARNLLKLRQGRVPVAFLQASSFPLCRRQFPDSRPMR